VAYFIATMAGTVVSANAAAIALGPSAINDFWALGDVASVVSGSEVLLVLAAALFVLLGSVLLRVLVLGPVLRRDSPVTELALKGVGRFLLARGVGVGTNGVQDYTGGTRHLEYEDEVEI
jgi:hypothetical protein